MAVASSFLTNVNINLIHQKIVDLKSLKLIEDSEVQSFNDARKGFVEKFELETADLKDCIEFINLEEQLLGNVQIRRAERSQDAKRYEIDFSLINNLKCFYQNVLTKYASDYDMWKKYYRFCERFKMWGLGSELLPKFLDHHGDKPSAWLQAFDWEERASNKRQALAFLQAGIDKHPASVELNEKYIYHELNEARIAMENALSWQKTDVDDKKFFMKGKGAEDRYLVVRELIKDADFYLRLLQYLKPLPCAATLKDLVAKDVLERFDDSEDVWNMKASKMFADTSQTNRERYERTIAVYQEAVKKVNTQKMWDYYLDFIVARFEDPGFTHTGIKRNSWRAAVLAASEAKKLAERHYLTYLKALHSFGQKMKLIRQVLELGTKEHPHSIELWRQRLSYHMQRNEESLVRSTYKEAMVALAGAPAASVLKIFKIFLAYVRTFSIEEADQLYLEGLRGREDLAHLLKPLYLEWIMIVDGIGEARKLMDNPLLVEKPNLDFYLLLAKSENRQPEPCKKTCRTCFETATKHFGSTSAKLWCEYIAFEVRMGDITRLPSLYETALGMLDEDQKRILESTYPRSQIFSRGRNITF